MPKLLLFRHGERDNTDALTPHGRESVIQNTLLVPAEYRDLDVVYSSPRQRCRETAHLVSECLLGKDSVIILPDLHDVVTEEDFLPEDRINEPYLRKFQKAVRELLRASPTCRIILVGHSEQAESLSPIGSGRTTLEMGKFLEIDTDHLLSL